MLSNQQGANLSNRRFWELCLILEALTFVSVIVFTPELSIKSQHTTGCTIELDYGRRVVFLELLKSSVRQVSGDTTSIPANFVRVHSEITKIEQYNELHSSFFAR
jgi:hypothetical protein